MTDADRNALRRMLGASGDVRASADDLQGLLLQVVFALLMVFMIAYFIFVDQQKKDRAEEVMAVNRQKLTLALEKVAEDYRIRYGLNALMTQGTDGKRTFEPDEHVRDGKLSLSPAAKSAFSGGSSAAFADYSKPAELAAAWRRGVFAAAGLAEEEVADGDVLAWLDKELAANVEAVRLDARGVQRALAARLQKQWTDNPDSFASTTDPSALAETLKAKSLELVEREIQSEVLP